MARGPERTICKIQQPLFPQFLFEWHEDTGKVWIVGLPGRFEDGVFVPSLGAEHTRAQVLAEHCDTHGRAYGFVQSYLRGYRQGLADQQIIDAGKPSSRRIGYEDAGLGGPPVHTESYNPGKVYG